MFIVKITFDGKIEKKFYLINELYIKDVLYFFGNEDLRKEVERIILQEMEDTSSNGNRKKVYNFKFENTDILIMIIKKEDPISNFNIEHKRKLPIEDRRYLEEKVLFSLLRNIREA
ncbi:MAG: hypothetical protein QW472_04340 [Candidatus Aenigmatarchaeota archaeon]